MTQTEVNLSELQQDIAHLAEVSEKGWVLQWGSSPETSFEVVCKKANALQVQRLEAILSRAHEKAMLTLK